MESQSIHIVFVCLFVFIQYLFLSDMFRLAPCPQGPAMLLQVVIVLVAKLCPTLR